MKHFRLSMLALIYLSFSSLQSEQTWKECIVQDVTDTVSTGMPIAVLAATVWYIANRIPHEWEDLEGPAAEFIFETWEDQDFLKARSVLLKRIPLNSVLSRLVVYTQELPGAMAVGQPFVERIESLLEQKTSLITLLVKNPEKEDTIRQQLREVEKGLDECRFVCGHERVHKECHHTYQLLGTQFMAPFIVYSFFKHVRMLIAKKMSLPVIEWVLQRSMTRSSAEILIGWLRAYQVECDGDIYASDDPEILRAGLRLFKRAQKKRNEKCEFFKPPKDLPERFIGLILKYTHPTLDQRIKYLTGHIKEMEERMGVVCPSLNNEG